jgi:hypothetical protein
MRIGKPELRIADGRAVIDTRIESDHLPKSLAFSAPASCRDLLSESSDAQLVALLIPAMARGEPISVAGTVSEKLIYSLAALQVLLREVMPFLHGVEIRPANISRERSDARGVATGFSGGIDSFCVLADHHYAPVAEGFRITHLLYNNVGSHDTGGEATFRRRHQRLLPLTDRLGLPLIDIDSNLDAFYGQRLGFQQTHTARNAAVALLLGAGIGRFMYASAYRFGDVSISAWHDTAPTDLITLPMLSTESTQCFSVGSEYTRVEKTLKVAELPDSHDFLDVCTKTWTEKNCGCCPKCNRTLITLQIAGRMQDYERVFDLAAYRKVSSGYLGRVFMATDPFSREIARFAEAARFPRSAYSRLYGAAWRTKESLKRLTGSSLRA